MIPDQEGRRPKPLQHHRTSNEAKKIRRKKIFERRFRRKSTGKKKEVQTGGSTPVSFRR
jgi:hypothetical protein